MPEQINDMDPVEFWASMIIQEGKPAALELVERVGAEGALDAMEFIASKRQEQVKRLRVLLAQAYDEMAAAGDMNDGLLGRIARELDKS